MKKSIGNKNKYDLWDNHDWSIKVCANGVILENNHDFAYIDNQISIALTKSEFNALKELLTIAEIS